MPEYGRYPDWTGYGSSFLGGTVNVNSWEECGRLCYNTRSCMTWAWNNPFNQCATTNGRTACNTCQMFSATIATKRNADWISGSWNCFKSNKC